MPQLHPAKIPLGIPNNLKQGFTYSIFTAYRLLDFRSVGKKMLIVLENILIIVNICVKLFSLGHAVTLNRIYWSMKLN